MKKVILTIMCTVILGFSLISCKSNTSNSDYDENNTANNIEAGSINNSDGEVANISIQFGEGGKNLNHRYGWQ